MIWWQALGFINVYQHTILAIVHDLWILNYPLPTQHYATMVRLLQHQSTKA